MKVNLDSLRTEIQQSLESRGIAVFHGLARSGEVSAVYWDTGRHPDYREFLAAAQAAGVRLVTMYAHEFTGDLIDDAEEQLDLLPREESLGMEQRLRQMRAYTGFICQIELSFDLAPRLYIFDLRTDWYDDLNDMIDQIEDAPEEEDPLGGGYFSNN